MITLPGYQAIETLSDNSRSLIYRSRRTADNTPAMLARKTGRFGGKSLDDWLQERRFN